MGRNYYYLVAGLPDLTLGGKCTTTQAELRELVAEELTASDYGLVSRLYLPYDHLNILNRLYDADAPFDELGVYGRDTIDELTDKAAAVRGGVAGVEAYLNEFVADFYASEAKPTRAEAANRLSDGQWTLIENCGNRFMSGYAKFERQMRNVLAALQARRHGLSVDRAVVGTDDVAEALRHSRAHDFGLKSEVDYLEQLMSIFETEDLQEREMKLDALRWNFCDEASFFDYFSVERVAVAIVQFSMAERWAQMDGEAGRAKFAAMISDLKNTYHSKKTAE